MIQFGTGKVDFVGVFKKLKSAGFNGPLVLAAQFPEGADTDPSRTFTVDEVACLGCCSLAPVLMVDGHTAGRLTPATARNAIEETA